jgi:hypothetical protein
MREVHPAALRHGIEVADIKHALRHPMKVVEHDDGSRLHLGPGRNAELLEVVTVRRPDGSERAVHAMKMRPKYATLLPRE